MKIKFVQVGETRGDCTSSYDVILDTKCTVREFISLVLLTQKDERGHIGIKSKNYPFFGNPFCEYENGKIKGTQLEDKILSKKVKSVTANGGWGLMDYIITTCNG